MMLPFACNIIMEAVCSRHSTLKSCVFLLASLFLIVDRLQRCHSAVDKEEFSGDVWHEFLDNAIKRSVSQTSTTYNYRKAMNAIRDSKILSRCIIPSPNPVKQENQPHDHVYDLKPMCGIHSVWLVADSVLTFSFAREWYIHSWGSMINITINRFFVPDNVFCNNNHLVINGVMGIKPKLCGRLYKQSYFARNDINLSLVVHSPIRDVIISYSYQIGIFQTVLSHYRFSNFFKDLSRSSQLTSLPPSLMGSFLSFPFVESKKRICYQFYGENKITRLAVYFNLLRNVSLYVYDGPGSLSPLLMYFAERDDVVFKQFKFHRRLYFVPAFVELLLASANQLPADIDALVPVPLHPYRHMRRGYNQAAELAGPLGKAFELPVLSNVRRVAATPSQSGLSAAERRRNLLAAFAVRGRIRARHVVIVDDVVTTGATCQQLARVLKAAGAKKVSVLAIARA